MNPGMAAMFAAIQLCTICPLMCCGFDKIVPINYMLLSLFTMGVSWLTAMTCHKTNPQIVLEAVCLTTSMVIGITFYAATSSTDFTIFGPLLSICGFVFCTGAFFLCTFGYHLGLVW